MKSIVIEIKIVGDKLNRLSVAEERIGEMEDKPEEIIHNTIQKDKKVENMSWEAGEYREEFQQERIKRMDQRQYLQRKEQSIFQNQRLTFLDSWNTVNPKLDKDIVYVENPNEPAQKILEPVS